MSLSSKSRGYACSSSSKLVVCVGEWVLSVVCVSCVQQYFPLVVGPPHHHAELGAGVRTKRSPTRDWQPGLATSWTLRTAATTPAADQRRRPPTAARQWLVMSKTSGQSAGQIAVRLSQPVGALYYCADDRDPNLLLSPMPLVAALWR